MTKAEESGKSTLSVKQPMITFDCRRGIVRIHRATLEALGLPEFYRFLFHAEKKRFAIEGCTMDDVGYHIFRGLKENDNHSYTQNSLAMIDSIYQLCQWDKEQVYRVPGISLFGGKVICFELSEAEMITA